MPGLSVKIDVNEVNTNCLTRHWTFVQSRKSNLVAFVEVTPAFIFEIHRQILKV
jgi:hypothetical protein